MIHELRIYHCLPGRLPALLDRFAKTTLGFWQTHDIRPLGFWTVEIGDSNHELYYILEWESLAARERKWNAFQADPDWIKARAQTEAAGPIVQRISNQILNPTSFSAIR